jgi:hypothetical protein
MGGFWVRPIELINRFQATVSDSASGQEQQLSKAAEFSNYPCGNRFK